MHVEFLSGALQLLLCRLNVSVQIQYEIRARKLRIAIFELFEELEVRRTQRSAHLRATKCEITRRVSVGEHDTLLERSPDLRGGEDAVRYIRKRGEVGIEFQKISVFSCETFLDELSDDVLISGKPECLYRLPFSTKFFLKEFELGCLARTIDAFKNDEFPFHASIISPP